MTSSLADLQAILRWHFASFVEKCFQEVSNSEFKSNWHIDYICQELEDMMSGKNLRLIINIPPRNLPSRKGMSLLENRTLKNQIIILYHLRSIQILFGLQVVIVLSYLFFLGLF